MTQTASTLSRWSIVDDDSALGPLHCVGVGYVTNVSEVETASIFNVEVSTQTYIGFSSTDPCGKWWFSVYGL